MKNLLGVVLILLGICVIGLAIYVGLWVMCIGGIIQIIEAAKMTPVDSSNLAIGIVKVVFCEMSSLIAIPGYLLIGFGGGALMDQ